MAPESPTDLRRPRPTNGLGQDAFLNEAPGAAGGGDEGSPADDSDLSLAKSSLSPEEITPLPPRPASVAEWEDLLVRLEIAPRVARLSVDETVDAEAAALALERATAREAEVGRLLDIAARLPERAHPSARPGEIGEPATISLRFASLRARTFAMVQRRGLEVWDWEAPLNGGTPVTVHQLLRWLANRDANLLAELRATSGAGWGGC